MFNFRAKISNDKLKNDIDQGRVIEQAAKTERIRIHVLLLPYISFKINITSPSYRLFSQSSRLKIKNYPILKYCKSMSKT
jgi:hypothetical protein